jgi:hypothetical protein
LQDAPKGYWLSAVFSSLMVDSGTNAVPRLFLCLLLSFFFWTFQSSSFSLFASMVEDPELIVEVFVLPDLVFRASRDYSFTGFSFGDAVQCFYRSVSHEQNVLSFREQIQFFIQYSKATVLYGFWRNGIRRFLRTLWLS